ncbi:MAG TPA: serine hydrolase domain-containing protein [Rhizomicrobium sp.]|nr:serine hydrolase domain-containing protein [Rhizomicrobium sp.]
MPPGGSFKEKITRRALLAALPAMPSVALAQARKSTPTHDFGVVRENILDAVTSGKATGVAVAMVHHGRIIWEEGFGWADREAGLKATSATPFCLASIGKPFTATLLTILAADRMLELDAPANFYLAGNPLQGADADRVSVRHLGAHASGLPSLFEMYTMNEDAPAPTTQTLLRNYGRLAYPAGRTYEYSNIGYAALGAVASTVTDMAFDAVLTHRLLKPLGLHDSFFDTDATRLVGSAARYSELDKPIPFYTSSTPPSGEVYASAHDLALFAAFHLKHRTKAGPPVLDASWIDEMQKPVLPGLSAGATTFGWFSGLTKSGLKVLYKNGGQPGVSTILYLVPSENLACLVLTNRSDNGNLAQTLADKMIAAVLPGWARPDTRMSALRSPFPGTTEFVGRWTGRLTGGGADMKVDVDIAADAEATLSLNDRPAENVKNLQLEGGALIGNANGLIDAADTIKNKAAFLDFKLLRRDTSLAGRIIANSSTPERVAAIPFIVSLNRM